MIKGADDLPDEAREALALYAVALSKAATDEERNGIRQAIRELLDPRILGIVRCPYCHQPIHDCGCHQNRPME